MIYVTGDTHIPIDIKKLSTKHFPEQKNMTENDCVIICGDFGGVWDNSPEEMYWRKWLSEKPFTILFVDGNHENHPLLNTFPDMKMFGGTVKVICSNVFYLQRGYVYNICGKTFFTMGGASSHDKEVRVVGKSWWPEEMPSNGEYERAMKSLKDANFKVDYIITHCAPDSIQEKIAHYYKHDKLTNFFEAFVKERCTFKQWYFGHYHINAEKIDGKYTVLYDKIIKIF